MSFEIIYSAGREKLAEEIEKRKIEKYFNSLADPFVSEDEKRIFHENKNLRIVENKYEYARVSQIVKLVVENPKSF